MCDPLSVITGVLTVAGVAATSCEGLYKTLRQLSKAPKDIQHHLSAIQALQSTLTAIAALGDDAATAEMITPHFKAQLQSCMLDLQAVEKLAQSFQLQLEEGRARRTWARMRWSLVDQQQKLKTHLSRIESYHRTFSLDLLLINIHLGLRPQAEGHLAQDDCSRLSDLAAGLRGGLLSHACASRSAWSECSEHVSVRSMILTYFESDFCHLLLWLGPFTALIGHNSQNLDSGASKFRDGYGVSLVASSHFYRLFRLELAVYVKTSWKAANVRLSIHWNLFWPHTVSWEAEITKLVLFGNVDAVKKQFSTKLSTPFDQLPDGMTLLHLAASNSHFELVKFLLHEGSRPNAVTDFGETPLHSAIALSTNYDISRVLLENGSDLHNRNVDGRTPLHTFSSCVTEQVLRCHGCLFDFSTLDHRGMSVLHYMAWSSKTSKENFRKYHELSNFDLSTVDAEGRSLLHFAAQRGNLPVVEYIACAAKHFNINHTDCKGRTAVHYGTESKRARNTLRSLLSHGADIWTKDYCGRSALHHATRLRNLPAVKELLTDGMIDELRAADSDGMTPLMTASYHNADAVVMFLLEVEGRSSSSKNQTAGLTESSNMPAAPTDTRCEISLSIPPRMQHLDVPVGHRQSYTQRYGLWKGALPTSQRRQSQLSGQSTCWSVIKFLAIMAAVLVVIVLLLRKSIIVHF